MKQKKKPALILGILVSIFSVFGVIIVYFFRIELYYVSFYIMLILVFICGVGSGALYTLPISIYGDAINEIERGENNENASYLGSLTFARSNYIAEKEKQNLISKRSRCAVFVDRDGTINKDTVHLFKKEEFEFLPDADKAISDLKKKGYLIIVITNQAGIAKGLYKDEDVGILHCYVDSLLEKEYSVAADGYYYCPHHPNAVIDELRLDCSCRKPNAGLILKAVEDFEKTGITIDLSNSYTIGNRISDVLAGINAGTAQNILIGDDETDDDNIASAVYCSLYEAANNIKQVF